MSLHWIDVKEYSFNSLLLLERFQIELIGKGAAEAGFGEALGIALKGNPCVAWVFEHRAPGASAWIEPLLRNAPEADKARTRRAELAVMDAVEDFVVYTTPERMERCCDFIYGWDPERLLELADFSGKRVLDVGSGTGRLAFAAARCAGEVYASEPVDTLRQFMRDKIAREGIPNVRVANGLATELPFPDHCFDIVMSGHVVGDEVERELAELTRVVRPGGWLLDCPGEESRPRSPRQELLERGWEQLYYHSETLGGDVYRYRIQIKK